MPAASAPTRSAFSLRSCSPLTVLRLISLSHATRSVRSFARGTSRRRRRNTARHFSLRSTQRRRSVASPSRTARSKRGRFKSQSKSEPPYPRLAPVPAVYPVAPVPRPLIHVGCANPALDSKAFAYGLVRAKVVRDHRLCPVTAYETTEPLHESVRIALDQRAPEPGQFQRPRLRRRPFSRSSREPSSRPRLSLSRVRAFMCDIETPKARTIPGQADTRLRGRRNCSRTRFTRTRGRSCPPRCRRTRT